MGFYYPYQPQSNWIRNSGDFSMNGKRNFASHPYGFFPSGNMEPYESKRTSFYPHNQWNKRYEHPWQNLIDEREIGKVTKIPIYYSNKGTDKNNCASTSTNSIDEKSTVENLIGEKQTLDDGKVIKSCDDKNLTNEVVDDSCEHDTPINIQIKLEEELEKDVSKTESKVKAILAEIDRILVKVNGISNEIDLLPDGNVQEKNILRFEEILTKYLIELDKILAEGEEQIRLARKNVVKEINKIFDKLANKIKEIPSDITESCNQNTGDTDSNIIETESDNNI